MRTVFVILILSVGLVVWGNAKPADIIVPVDDGRSDTLTEGLELPLPSVPSDLRSVPERAAYVLAHFWDGMDFRDTLRSRNKVFVEQNFVNFVSLFPHASGEVRTEAVKRLMQAAERDIPAYTLLAEMAGKYLYDMASPMWCEEYYILFLEEFVATSVWDELEKVRYRHLLEAARKNRPGMPAADFTYLTRDGKQQTLRHTPGNNLLLIFYDPVCEHCREVMAQLQSDVLVRQQIQDKRLTILAVCVDTGREVWDLTKTSLPTEWVIGFETGHLQEQELYVLPELPTIYLLDADRNVVLKEILPQNLLQVLMMWFHE
ncbi:MAG: DUF5106 domain-containing protein [Odoribacter sp.]|nr:DUF5106 domain-containing protein [Odoribacter sp.]